MPAGTAIEERAMRSIVKPGEQSCCCPANPVYVVMMPPTPARPHQTEMLLCGHHTRVSMGALQAQGAQIRLLGNRSSDDHLAV